MTMWCLGVMLRPPLLFVCVCVFAVVCVRVLHVRMYICVLVSLCFCTNYFSLPYTCDHVQCHELIYL